MTASEFTLNSTATRVPLPDPADGDSDAWQLSDSFAFQAAMLGALIERRLTATLAPYELTSSEFRVLVALEKLGPSTAADLAKLTPIDPSFISRTVQRLAERGFLARRRSRNDRRTIVLRPTQEALRVLAQVRQPLRQLDAEVVEGMSAKELERAEAVVYRLLMSSLRRHAA